MDGKKEKKTIDQLSFEESFERLNEKGTFQTINALSIFDLR